MVAFDDDIDPTAGSGEEDEDSVDSDIDYEVRQRCWLCSGFSAILNALHSLPPSLSLLAAGLTELAVTRGRVGH